MTTFWSSLSSVAALQSYFTSNWAAYQANGQLPAQDWDCKWENPDWTTCLVTSWQWPVGLSIALLLWGMFV